MCYSQRNGFSISLVDFVNLPDLKNPIFYTTQYLQCKFNIPRASKSVFKMSLSGGGERRYDFCCRFFWLKGQVKSSLSDLNESFSLFAVENFPGFRKLDHGTYLGLKFIGIVMTRTLPFAITSFSVVSTETRICSYVCSLLHPPTGC